MFGHVWTCLDICVSNIRVGIRVRGLHLVVFFRVPPKLSSKSGRALNLKLPTKQSLMTITLAIVEMRFDRLDWENPKATNKTQTNLITEKHEHLSHASDVFSIVFRYACSFLLSFFGVCHSFIGLSTFSLLSKLLCLYKRT